MDCRAAFQAARNDEWRDIVANKKTAGNSIIQHDNQIPRHRERSVAIHFLTRIHCVAWIAARLSKPLAMTGKRNRLHQKNPLETQPFVMTINFRVIASEAWRSIFKPAYTVPHGLPRGFSSRSQ